MFFRLWVLEPLVQQDLEFQLQAMAPNPRRRHGRYRILGRYVPIGAGNDH